MGRQHVTRTVEMNLVRGRARCGTNQVFLRDGRVRVSVRQRLQHPEPRQQRSRQQNHHATNPGIHPAIIQTFKLGVN
jgi:hypothetical protein